MSQLLERIRESGVLRLVAIDDPRKAPSLARTPTRAGLSVIEITCRPAAAEDGIQELHAAANDLLAGTGAMFNSGSLERTSRVRSDFVRSPGICADIARQADSIRLPVFPGVATPSDVQQAVAVGARLGFDRISQEAGRD